MSGGTDILQAHGDPSPRVLWKCSLEDFDQYKKNLDEEADPVRGRAEAHTRFCMDMDRNRLVGAVQLRFPSPSISLATVCARLIAEKVMERP